MKIPYFETYYREVIIKTSCYLHKNRHANLWSRTGTVETYPCTTKPHFETLTKNQTLKKVQSLQQIVLEKLDLLMQKYLIRSDLTPHTKVSGSRI